MQTLSEKAFGKLLDAREAEGDVAAIGREVGGTEEVVPDAEGDAKVDSVRAVGGKVLGMVPDVHLWVVEQILKDAEVYPEVGMVEMADGQGEEVDDEKVAQADANEGEWKVLDGAVDDGFHPVVAQVRGKAHLAYGVVHFVKLP